MSSFLHAASSTACIASTESLAPCLKRVDFVAGYRGLSLPTLVERIGIMAADKPNSGRPESSATHQGCVRVPVGPTATLIASGPAHTGRQPDTDGEPRGSPGLSILRRTSTSAIVSGRRLRRRGTHTRAGPFTRSGGRIDTTVDDQEVTNEHTRSQQCCECLRRAGSIGAKPGRNIGRYGVQRYVHQASGRHPESCSRASCCKLRKASTYRCPCTDRSIHRWI